VVDIEHLSLGDGEQVALVGSSGSGKTTLLHLIAGILTPDSGKILFDATTPQSRVDLAQLSEAERDIFRGRNIGYIFQTHHLLGGFTALENVLLGMSFTGRAHDPAWATHLLKEVGLAERLHYKPQKLSVGQQQRVAVARALANRPKLVPLAVEGPTPKFPIFHLQAQNTNAVIEVDIYARKSGQPVGAGLG